MTIVQTLCTNKCAHASHLVFIRFAYVLSRAVYQVALSKMLTVDLLFNLGK